jgi:outer membrane protein
MNRWQTLLMHIPGAVLAASLLMAPTAGAQPQTAPEPLTLSQSIDLALKQSALLRAAREGVLGAEAQRKEALTGFLPTFSTSYSYTRLNEEPSFYFPGVGTIPPQHLKSGTKDNYQWQIEARQPLFAGGTIAANYEASRLGAAIARQDEVAAGQGLVEEVQVAYFRILQAERILAVAEQSLAQRQAHRDTAAEFFGAGLVPRNDLLHAEVEVANGEQALLRAQNTLALAKARFNTLLKRPGDTPVAVAAVPYEPPSGEPLESAIAKALAQRPELKAADLRASQAKSLVKAAQGEYFPALSLQGTYARYGDTAEVAGSATKDRENWAALVVAQWNFWEWGRTRYRVEAQASRESQAAERLSHGRDQVALEDRKSVV